jgi:predicted nucleotide-binding protein
MARPTTRGSAPHATPPSLPPERAIELLRRQREKGTALLNKRPLGSDHYDAWETVTADLLRKAFGSESPNVGSVMDVGRYDSIPMSADEHWWENHRAQNFTKQLTILDSLIELLETETELASGAPPAVPETKGNSVFLVHGRDEAALQATARFLEKLRLPVIVLREQPNEGRTIIEKFVDYSDVGFAVVLLTPDDRGGLASDAYGALRLRSRQNVILELGFFLGKLGRKRVCALYQEEVEIPSDYGGVAFVKLDKGCAWRLELAREMKAAGLEIDMNLAL